MQEAEKETQVCPSHNMRMSLPAGCGLSPLSLAGHQWLYIDPHGCGEPGWGQRQQAPRVLVAYLGLHCLTRKVPLALQGVFLAVPLCKVPRPPSLVALPPQLRWAENTIA